MYRIFCESYRNFLKTFDKENYRLQISKPFELIVNIDKYEEEKLKQSDNYKKISDLISFMKENEENFPRFKAFLWTLEGRGIQAKKYNLANKEELEEQTKLVNSFLKLAYWYE